MTILSLCWVGGSTARLIIAFGLITCLLPAFVSNTATVAMPLLTAIGTLSVIAELPQHRELVAPDFDPLRLRVGVALMLVLAYGASVGGHAGTSPSTGRTRRRSTGVGSCCSAPASSSARCSPTPARPRPSATARRTRSA